MAKQAYVYSGTDWVPLASEVTNLSGYYTKGEVDTSFQTKATTGLVLLNTTSFSGVTSISLNDVFSATYQYYKIVINAKEATSAGTITLRLRVSGSDNSTNNYYIAGNAKGSSDAGITNASADPGTSFRIGTITNNNTTITTEIGNPFATDYTSITTISGGMENTNEGYLFFGAGGFAGTTSFTGFTIIGVSMTGRVSVYGYSI